MRLKLWVKIVLFILITGTISVIVFQMGRKIGMELARENMQQIGLENELLAANESEEKDVINLAEKEPYVIDLLMLVNKDYGLPEDYEGELLTMYDKVNRAAKEAYGPLNEMLAAGRAEGLAFEICSSYRDVKVQKRLFQEDLDVLMAQGYTYEAAYEEVAKDTMPPGHSEHSTGLAFDIVSLGYQILDGKQEFTPETQWLHENCAKYGFILRYPKGKEDITKISFESWHYRYVGVEVATYIMEQGLCLEEYLDEIGKYELISEVIE